MKGGIPTILKDGSKMSDMTTEGWALVKFNSGTRSLMRVEKVERDIFSNQKRLYGKNIYGDYHVAWAHNCLPATEQDRKLWSSREGDRVHYTDGRIDMWQKKNEEEEVKA